VNSAYNPGEFTLFEEADLDTWRGPLEVNLFGSLQMTQEVVPHLKAAGGGAIVNINSQIHKKPMPYQAAYATSKGALEAATKMLAKELGAHKIRVNSVFMGWMWGPPVEGYVSMTARGQGVPEDTIIAGITKDIALGIIPDDSDCANAVAFLCSDYAKVITGAGLDVNGGEFMP
jgi:NAD(P)-dependent dehydrogenase (short-subunit alcohol dehydrogenase family)